MDVEGGPNTFIIFVHPPQNNVALECRVTVSKITYLFVSRLFYDDNGTRREWAKDADKGARTSTCAACRSVIYVIAMARNASFKIILRSLISRTRKVPFCSFVNTTHHLLLANFKLFSTAKTKHKKVPEYFHKEFLASSRK